MATAFCHGRVPCHNRQQVRYRAATHWISLSRNRVQSDPSKIRPRSPANNTVTCVTRSQGRMLGRDERPFAYSGHDAPPFASTDREQLPPSPPPGWIPATSLPSPLFPSHLPAHRWCGMVGKFGLGGKSSPSRHPRSPNNNGAPPPYQENGLAHENQLFAAETTTTTTHVVTTTTHTTTTHFFSLPLWIRRGPPALSTAAPKPSRISTDELGVVRRPSSSPNASVRDKELPPTPSSDELKARISANAATGSAWRHDSGIEEVGNHHDADIGRASVSSSFPALLRSSPSLGESSSHSTVALARAALGLGLPHVMPGSVSASSSTSEVNTLTLVPPSVSPPTEPRSSQPTMRRVKSYYKDPDASGDENISSSVVRERRRTRGLSLGPLQAATSDKGKEKQRDPEPGVPASAPAPKALSRKGSFWRRRVDSHAPVPVSRLTVEPAPHPSLPSLQPISPFYVETSVPTPIPSAPGPSVQQSADLRRRHSERSRSSSRLKPEYLEAMPPPEVPAMPPATPRPSRFHRQRRPKTADSATSPRAGSFFMDVPRVVTSSPPPIEHPLPQHDHNEPHPPTLPPSPTSSRPPPAPRPRSQTNPPLLHRLSMNLFGTSPTSSSSHVVPSPLYDTITGNDQLSASPSSSHESSRRSLNKRSIEIPKPRADEESPEVYLERLTEAVSKAEVATVLASK